MPVIKSYISVLVLGLVRMGNPRISIMTSSGGLISTVEATEKRVGVIESGQAEEIEHTRLLSINSLSARKRRNFSSHDFLERNGEKRDKGVSGGILRRNPCRLLRFIPGD